MTRGLGRTSAAALIVLSLLPMTAQAQHRAPRGSRVQAQPRAHAAPPPHHHFHHRGLGSRLVVVAPFVPFGYYSATSVVYSAPPVYYAPPPVMYPAPAAYDPAPAYAAPAAPTSAPAPQQEIQLQREVVFPSGRYVLRGDGITTPYTWVWIPNPPTSPPGGAPSSSRNVERSAYTWTDADGVTTWTDRLSNVPPAYRATARRGF